MLKSLERVTNATGASMNGRQEQTNQRTHLFLVRVVKALIGILPGGKNEFTASIYLTL